MNFFFFINTLQVNVSLNLRNIFEVNEKAQYVNLETSLRMFWKDERLTSVPIGDNEFVIVNGKAIEKFWIPGEYRQLWVLYKTTITFRI